MPVPFVQLKAISVTGAANSFSELSLVLDSPTQEGNTLFVGVFSDGTIGLGVTQGLDGLNADSVSDNTGTEYECLQIQSDGWPQQNIWAASTCNAGITGVNVNFTNNANSSYGVLVVAELYPTQGVDSFAGIETHFDADSLTLNLNTTGPEEFAIAWGFSPAPPVTFQNSPSLVSKGTVALSHGESFGLYYGRLRVPGANSATVNWSGSNQSAVGAIAFLTVPPAGPWGPLELFGTILNPDLTGANGWLLLQLNTYGTVTQQAGGYAGILPNDVIRVRCNNGALVPGTYVYGNDGILPDSYYIVQFQDDQGKILFTENWYISGDNMWDVGAAVPISSEDLPKFLAISLSQISNVDSDVTPADIQHETFIYAPDTGTPNNYEVAITPDPTLVDGSILVFTASHSCTGPSSVSINGGSTIAIKKQGGTEDVGSGDILANQILVLRMYGGVFQLAGITIKVNGTNLSAQNVFNFVAGDNLELTDLGGGSLRIDAVSGGSASGTVFGRSLPVTAEDGDYNFDQIAGTVASTQLPIALTGALGAFKPDGTSIIVNPSTGVARATAGILIQVQGFDASSQDTLNFVAGPGAAITDMGAGQIKFTASGAGITQLTGDVLASGTGTVGATLKTISGVSGTYLFPEIIQVDANGRVLGVTSGTAPTGSTGGGSSSSGGNATELDGVPIDTLVGLTEGMVLQYSAMSGKWEPVVDKPFQPVAGVPGKPTPSQLVMMYCAGTAVVFPADFIGSVGSCSSAPAASATYIVKKNNVVVGTVIATPAGTFSFSTSGAVLSLNAQDRMDVLAPASQDPTLSDVTITFVGTRASAVPNSYVFPILRWHGTYSSIATYQPWDLVFYNGSTYLCLLMSIGNLPTNTTYFAQFAAGTAGGGSNPVENEIPSGSVNGSNSTFVLAHTPNPASSVKLFVDGLRWIYGVHFSVTANSMSLGAAPVSGANIVADYRY